MAFPGYWVNNMKITDTLIVIMSSGRAGKVVTHNKFPKNIIKYVIAVPEKQVPDYEKEYPNIPIVSIPEEVPSFIAPHRQWVMEHFAKEYAYIWLMDDDLTYLKRNSKLKLKKAKKKQVLDMFLVMREQLNSYVFAAISPRLGNNRQEEDFVDVGRMMDSYAFNTKVFIEEGINFAPYPDIIGEDFHVTLTYLNKGYPNRIIFSYSQSDGGRNADGGCSDYRSNETQKKAAFWLAEHHPEVTVKTKKSNNWKGLSGTKDGTRVDMIVQWKKAYKCKEVRKTGGLSRLLKK